MVNCPQGVACWLGLEALGVEQNGDQTTIVKEVYQLCSPSAIGNT